MERGQGSCIRHTWRGTWWSQTPSQHRRGGLLGNPKTSALFSEPKPVEWNGCPGRKKPTPKGDVRVSDF